MRSTPKPPSISKPPPLPPVIAKSRELPDTKDTDHKIKWILAAAISAGILIALFLIPLMLLSSNGGGSADGKDDGARVKGAVALSIDNGTSNAPQSLPAQASPATTDPVVKSPNESSEKAEQDDPIERQSVPMLLTYQLKSPSRPKSSAGTSSCPPLRPVATRSIWSTTSVPLTTLPNTA